MKRNNQRQAFQSSYDNHRSTNGKKLTELVNTNVSVQSLELELKNLTETLEQLPEKIKNGKADFEEYQTLTQELAKINAELSKIGLSQKQKQIDNQNLQKQIEAQNKEIEALEAANKSTLSEITETEEKIKTTSISRAIL